MEVRFAVFIAVSLDGFIARPDGGIEWLRPFEGEDHGYEAFFARVDALVIGRGTYDTVLGFPSWPYGRKRVIVGAGRPLFATGLPELPLRLLEAKSYPSGLVQLRYAPA